MASVKPSAGHFIYHITTLKNLETIVENGLAPRNQVTVMFDDIADEEILQNRDKFDLGDYTPFHFMSGSPFAGIVQKSNTDKEFVYIAIKRVDAKQLNFKIVPKHPLRFRESPLEWEQGLKIIDWDLLDKREYHDDDCKDACLAECLYHGVLNAANFSIIFVKTRESHSLVTSWLRRMGLESKVHVGLNRWMFIK